MSDKLSSVVNKESLSKAYPEVIASIEKDAREKAYAEGLEQGKKDGFASGAEAERGRIMGLQELSIPGHEKIIMEAIADGKSTKSEVALKIVAAEKAILQTKRESLDEDAKERDAVKSAKVPDMENKPPKKNFEAEISRVMEEEKLSRSAAIRKVSQDNPELREEYIQQANKGKEVK